jgi:oligoribonuclease (3'-5' exoribonuclease)
MRYLSIDIEATGLKENDLMIEFAMIPFDASSGELAEDQAYSTYIQCPSFETLKPNLDPWVIEHNQKLIEKAHEQGISMSQFKQRMEVYLQSPEIKKYFNNQKIVLFGKSMNAIDLPFMNRDLGWNFMRQYFHHRQLDFSSACLAMIDLKILPAGMDSGTNLMRFLGMGEVAHNALDDAKNTAKMYTALLNKLIAK